VCLDGVEEASGVVLHATYLTLHFVKGLLGFCIAMHAGVFISFLSLNGILSGGFPSVLIDSTRLFGVGNGLLFWFLDSFLFNSP